VNVKYRQSKPVVVRSHKDIWSSEFHQIAKQMRAGLGKSAIRIDHIGSTSVKQLAAKDIIDIQITIENIEKAEGFISKMEDMGYRQRGEIRLDELEGCEPKRIHELKKLYFREPFDERRTHIHVRQSGYLNQRFALVFRDYLRTNKIVRANYEVIKYKLAEIYPEQIDGYLSIKDPLMNIIFQGAENWAKESNWKPDSEFF